MYLHLKFKNAGLLSYRKGMSGRSASPHFMYNQKVIGDTVTDTKSRGHDLTNPIPYTLLSNVLHCLCGEIPVPTKRKSIFTRNEKLDEIAKNSWFHFENELIFDKLTFASSNFSGVFSPYAILITTLPMVKRIIVSKNKNNAHRK